MTTAIEWTDETWNPTTGCDRVSPGCDNCYALTLAKRLKGMGQARYQNDGDPRTSGPGFRLTVHPDALDLPLRWKRPRRVFVNSMSDMFHEDVGPTFLAAVWRTMRSCPQHTFQILTKRSRRLPRAVEAMYPGALVALPNVWLGVSIESDRYTFRASHLRQTPAAVRFLSLEPLLGPLPSLNLDGIDWVIVGGESGPGARPMHVDWVRDIRDRCVAAGVPFFFKQWGAWRYVVEAHTPGCTDDLFPGPWECLYLNGLHGGRDAIPDATSCVVQRVGKAKAGRVLDGRTWDEYPS
jgi:protein gp37